MIHDKTFLRAITLATDIVGKGKTLAPIQDTPVASLYKSTPIRDAYNNMHMELDDVKPGELATVISSTTEGTLDNISLHDKVLGDTIDQLSGLVKTHISNARNVVVPIVTDAVEKMDEFIANRPNDTLSDYKIVSKSVPSVVANDYLINSIDGYVGTTLLTPDLPVKLKEKDYKAIVDLMLVGNSSFDESVVTLAGELGEDTIVSIYNSLFTTATVENEIKYSDIAILDNYDKLRYGSVIYLLASKLLEEVDNAGWDVSLSVYNKSIMQVRDYAGTLLAQSLSKIQLSVRTNQLVIRKDTGKKSVIVNGDVYKTWITTGGCPEVLLGLLVDGSGSDTSVASIDSNSDRYKQVWDSFTSFNITANKNRFYSDFKDFLISMCNTSLREISPLEEEYMTGNPDYKVIVSKRVSGCVNSLSHDDLEDTECLALKLVAKERFYFTSSYQILKKMKETTIAMPDINIREAALLSAIDYVTDYTLDQVTVESWS